MWTKWILLILPLVLRKLTPALSEFMKDSVKAMKKNAAATKNPYDDMFVEMLENVLNIK